MSKEREMLEWAAKAAGICLAWSSVDDLSPRRKDTWVIWNPLTDDGDALRLSVKLGIGIHPDLQVDEVSTSFMAGPYGYNTNEEFGEHPDPYAATRRAIVRAAAEIGRAM